MEKETKIRRWLRAAVCGFLLAVLLSFTGFSGQCAALERSVLRLHIPAHSDTAADQAVKIRVRDAVLVEAGKWMPQNSTFEEALAAVCTHLESLEKTANAVLEAEGVPYRAQAEVCDAWFPSRTYGNTVFPAGKYRTLRIRLGEGTGQNWWCVVFPEICVSGAGDLTDLPEAAQAAVSESGKPEVRFMAVEIFSRLCKFFDA